LPRLRRGDDDIGMAETHDPSSPVDQASSSEIVLRNDIVGLRVSGTLRQFALPAPSCTPSESSGAAIRTHALREFCCRLLGWSDERVGLVDEAMHDLLAATVRGRPIALRGEFDLVPIAYALHLRLLGSDYPFVVCDPRMYEGEGSVRTPPNRRTGLLALEAAMGGSVCVRSRRLPPDFDLFRAKFRESEPIAMIFVCLHGEDQVRDLLCRPLHIPSLAERASESDRLVYGAFDDAAVMLGVRRLQLSPHMRQVIFDHVGSFADLEKTALRLAALASARNPSQAAARLGMAAVSMMRWLYRRRWAMAILRELEECRTGTDAEST
jgi:hypothetical protein